MCFTLYTVYACRHGSLPNKTDCEQHCEFGRPFNTCPEKYRLDLAQIHYENCERCDDEDEAEDYYLALTSRDVWQGDVEMSSTSSISSFSDTREVSPPSSSRTSDDTDSEESDDQDYTDDIDACLLSYDRSEKRHWESSTNVAPCPDILRTRNFPVGTRWNIPTNLLEQETPKPPSYWEAAAFDFDFVDYTDLIWADRYFVPHQTSDCAAAYLQTVLRVFQPHFHRIIEHQKCLIERGTQLDICDELQDLRISFNQRHQELLARISAAERNEMTLQRIGQLGHAGTKEEKDELIDKLRCVHRMSWVGNCADHVEALQKKSELLSDRVTKILRASTEAEDLVDQEDPMDID